MNAVFQLSLVASVAKQKRNNRKGFASCKSDNYFSVDVFGFDGECENFGIYAPNASEASQIAENNASFQVSYVNVYQW